jgi:hypothetical protein
MSGSNKPTIELSPAVPQPSLSDELKKYRSDKLKNVRDQLPRLLVQLSDAGVVSAHVSYDGCGDSGQIEDVTFTDAEGKAIYPCDQTTFSEDQIMDLFYDLLEARYPGWENNDGAYGDFTWQLIDNKLQHTHNARFTDCDTTEIEGL